MSVAVTGLRIGWKSSTSRVSRDLSHWDYGWKGKARGILRDFRGLENGGRGKVMD